MPCWDTTIKRLDKVLLVWNGSNKSEDMRESVGWLVHDENSPGRTDSTAAYGIVSSRLTKTRLIGTEKTAVLPVKALPLLQNDFYLCPNRLFKLQRRRKAVGVSC